MHRLNPTEAWRHAPRPAPAGGDDRARRPVPPRTKIVLNVDVAALWRGYTEGDERCHLAGVGSIPVAGARRMLPGAALAVVITKGTDVLNVTHLGRKATA